jgi:phage recombination protein Bet
MANEKNEVAVKDASLTEFDVNGEKVKLSIPMIKKYLVSGGGNVSDEEAMMFLSLCKYQRLNPFVKDAYCIKYGTQAATMVIGKDVYTKRAEKNPLYNGMEHGVIVLTKDGETIERKGSFHVKGKEEIIGGWAKVYIKGREVPQYDSVAFDEYAGYSKNGELNSNWSKRPGTMIEKVAIMHALRNAFPNDFQGLYVEEEMSNGDLKVNVDVSEMAQADIENNANQTDFDDSAAVTVDENGNVIEG